MVSVTVEFKGFFARLAKKKMTTLSLKDNVQLIDVIQSISSCFTPQYREFIKDALVSRNGVKCSHKTKIYQGDHLVFLVPVIGGG